MEKLPQPYQRELAHQAINAGAQLVIGHHPHVVQEMEIYKGRPILYSLGNFAFGSTPVGGAPEGLAVRVTPPAAGTDGTGILELVPLLVQNTEIHFRPRPILAGEVDPLAGLMPKTHPCVWSDDTLRWTCSFPAPAVLGPPQPQPQPGH
jgi:poly-gamma-glutamate synthesis protein (capsule biosynthesis protein)